MLESNFFWTLEHVYPSVSNEPWLLFLEAFLFGMTPTCADSSTYMDPIYKVKCQEWVGFTCDTSQGLSPEQVSELQVNCPRSCGVCQTTRTSIGMVDREMDGWCGGPDADLLSTSTYPGCIDECAARSNCNAVRYVKKSNVCNLMSACTITNEDSRWRHATKPGNRRLGLSPHGERRLGGGVDIDYTVTPQQIANWTAEAEPSSNKLEDDDGASVGKHLPVLV